MVGNGQIFAQIYPLLVQAQPWFRGVTFSLDGARQDTHDRQRGHGFIHRVLRATSICVVKALPFTLNMVLTTHNRHEVAAMVELAARLGSAGVRFGHLMPTPETARHGLDLTPEERLAVEAEIWVLQQPAPIAVGMAPGYYSPNPFFPCAPLEREEYNLDYRGNLTLCCQLSGYSGGSPGTDHLDDLHTMSLAAAVERFHRRVGQYLEDKRERLRRGPFSTLDHFPCWYCVKYLGKASGLRAFPYHPWGWELGQAEKGARDADVDAAGASAP